MKLKFQMWEGNSIIFFNSCPKMFKVIFAKKSGTEHVLNDLFHLWLQGIFKEFLLSLEEKIN